MRFVRLSVKGLLSKAGKVVKVSDSKVEKWQSAAGTAIEAKLVAIEDDEVFVFETAARKDDSCHSR